MKITRLFLPLALMAAMVAPLSAQQASVKIDKITPEFDKSPDFTFGDAKKKRWTPQEWLVVEVTYENPNEIPIPEVTIRFHVTLKSLAANSQYFTGEVTYLNIMKGPHRGVAYIPPSALLMANGGKMPSANDVSQIGVELLDRGRVMAQMNLNSPQSPWWQSGTPITGQIFNKSQTPFAPLYWDYYDQLKLDAR